MSAENATVSLSLSFPKKAENTLAFLHILLTSVENQISFPKDQNLWKTLPLLQGSPNYGPRAKCGPRSHFIRPAKPFCQWWKK